MSELFTELSLGKFFESQVEKQPDHEFIVYPDRNLRFTYKPKGNQTLPPQLRVLEYYGSHLLPPWGTLGLRGVGKHGEWA